MTQVCVALRTQQLDAAHAVAVINPLHDLSIIQFAMKTRPTAAGGEFTVGAKQPMAATHTGVPSLLKVIIVFTAERRFRSRLAGDPELLTGEFSLPFLF